MRCPLKFYWERDSVIRFIMGKDRIVLEVFYTPETDSGGASLRSVRRSFTGSFWSKVVITCSVIDLLCEFVCKTSFE